jgi:hypothetical protein
MASPPAAPERQLRHRRSIDVQTFGRRRHAAYVLTAVVPAQRANTIPSQKL